MNLADALDIHARARPDHPAIIHGAERLHHAGFARQVRQTAAHLLALGLQPGAIVGLCLPDDIAHVVLIYALARAGIVMLPMDCRWTIVEQTNVAVHFGASAVLAPAAQAPIGDVTLIAVDAAWHAAVAQAPADLAFSSDGEAPLLLSLSSGTTGRPKGPMIAHRHMLRRFWTHWINLGLNSQDRYICATPLYFGGGRTFTLSVLFSGGTVILLPPPHQPADLLAEMARHDATSLFLVPTQIRRLLELPAAETAPLRRLNLLLSSGSALHPAERSAIRATLCPRFFEYYASTEGGGVSLLTPEDQVMYADSVGRPIFAVDVEVVDDSDMPLPPGQIGALRYRGPGVADGFHNDPEASREAFRHGWFYPGDLGEIDARGYVFLRGRRKDMIIRGGVNIYPGEIEAVLTSHPSVRDAAALGRPSARLGEEVAVFVVVQAPVPAEALIAWCRERLAPYKVPVHIVFIAALPRNSSGKVLKLELAALLAEGR
jgi:acyl-CoA synthetase (AMP-forming)/AMP-acid ligase II